jgi:twinkle protein
MGEFVGHEPCPSCGSSDALARYADNSAHCFACRSNFRGDGEKTDTVPTVSNNEWTPLKGEYMDLMKSRGLREETLRFAKYQIGEFKDAPAHIMNIFRDGQLVAQKLRTKDTKGLWLGETKDPPFYLQWLWGKGKSLTITEGELDALSLLQAWDLKWPVASLPNGTGSVKSAITQHYEWLDGFQKIVLMFDMDAPGRKAVEEAAELLPPGKVYIAPLPHKDANETLIKEGPGRLVQAFWDAKPYLPDGIISGSEISFEDICSGGTKGFSIRMPKLNDRLLGLRKGEITLLTAGSGIGKSTLARQWLYELHQDHNLKIGNVFLEENNVKTAQAYIALDNSVPLGRLRYDPELLSREQKLRSYEKVIKDRMWFYNHFGSLESTRLLSKLRYMAKVLGVDFIGLDHISIVTSGMESSSEGERKDIDILMTRLRQLVEETGVGVLGVVHLKRSKDKNFNEGDQVSLTDLRGSASLEQLSDNVIGLERNQQDESTESIARVLKCRETGETGLADTLEYRRDTGKLVLAGAQKAFKKQPEEPLTF